MGCEWSEVTLEDLIHVKHGYAFKGKHFVDGPTDDVAVTPGNFAIGGGFQQKKLKRRKSTSISTRQTSPATRLMT